MNKLIKVLALSTAAAMMALSFAGCGGKKTDTSAATSSTTKSAADYKLVTKGKLIMGTNAEFPPFEYKEGNNIVGVDAGIMTEVAKRLGLELEIKDMAFDSLSEALKGKTIDVIAAGFTVKPEREEIMDFTDSYYTAKQTVIVKSDSTIKSKDDLKGKKIGVQTGTTGDFDCAQKVTDKSNVIGYNNGSLAVDDMLSGKVDAVIIDNNPAKEYKEKQGDKVKLIDDQFTAEEYAIGISKGNNALMDAINQTLKDMKADGTFKSITDKYIK